MDSDVLIKVEGVGKKFCRDLKKSLWYGAKDIVAQLVPGKNDAERHLSLRPQEFWAVDDVSFELKRGECLGLIGPNGGGKSTLLKMLNGLIKPDKGRISIRGRVGALIELGAGFNPVLTGRENIYINGAVLGFTTKEIEQKYDDIVEFAEIGDFIETPVQNYSSGMRVRLGFSVAAQMEPDILLVDEVLAVGDLGFKVKCLNKINKLMEKSAVVFVSHTMQFISRICNEVIVLNFGTAEFHDTDVGKGIDFYQNKFEVGEKSFTGTGKAKVSNIRLSNGAESQESKGRLILNYEDDLLLSFDLQLDPSIKEPVIKIVIWNQELRPVLDCYSDFSDFKIAPLNNSEIKVKLKKMHLNLGIYSIIIVITDASDGQTLTRLHNAAHFQVKTTYTSWAPMLTKGEWSQL